MNSYLSQTTRGTTDTKFIREKKNQIKSFQAYFSANKATERKKNSKLFWGTFYASATKIGRTMAVLQS